MYFDRCRKNTDKLIVHHPPRYFPSDLFLFCFVLRCICKDKWLPCETPLRNVDENEQSKKCSL